MTSLNEFTGSLTIVKLFKYYIGIHPSKSIMVKSKYTTTFRGVSVICRYET